MSTEITYSIISHHAYNMNGGILPFIAKTINKKLFSGNSDPEVLKTSYFELDGKADKKSIQKKASTEIYEALQHEQRGRLHLIFLEANLITSGDQLNFEGNFFEQYQSSDAIFLLFHGSKISGEGANLPAFVGLQLSSTLSPKWDDFISGQTFGKDVVKELQNFAQTFQEFPEGLPGTMSTRFFEKLVKYKTDLPKEAERPIKKNLELVEFRNPFTDQSSELEESSHHVNPLGNNKNSGTHVGGKPVEQSQARNDDQKPRDEKFRSEEQFKRHKELGKRF
jgi:hypothetical protein